MLEQKRRKIHLKNFMPYSYEIDLKNATLFLSREKSIIYIQKRVLAMLTVERSKLE